MKYPVIRFLFILFLTNFFGMNVAKWADSHTLAISEPDGMEQVMEMEDESIEEPEGGEGGGGICFTSDLPPDQHLSFLHFSQVFYTLPPDFSSVKQSQVNLLRSFHEPALFILFNSYQGYIS